MVDATAETIISVDSVMEELEVESGAFRFRFVEPFPGSAGFLSSEVVFDVLAVFGLDAFSEISFAISTYECIRPGS